MSDSTLNKKKKKKKERKENVQLCHLPTRFIAKGHFPDILEAAFFDPLNGKKWHQRCGSKKFIHQKVVDLLHINREEVKTRPPFSTHVPELVHWIDVSDPEGLVLLLAHNGHKFDHRILRHHIQEFGLQVPPNWYFVDTLPMARDNAQGLRS